LLTVKEKYLIVGDRLKKHAVYYKSLNEEKMSDYVELLSIFLTSDCNVIQRGSIDTMNLLIENAIKKDL
jgi:hypothetical protein